MNRKLDIKLHHWKYKKLQVDSLSCFYCGESPTTWDHVPPISKCGYYPELKKHYLVPSCSECNKLLSNETHFDPYERLAYLKLLLNDRYRKLLASPDWTDKELKTVKGTLKQGIKASLRKKAIIIERLEWYPTHITLDKPNIVEVPYADSEDEDEW